MDVSTWNSLSFNAKQDIFNALPADTRQQILDVISQSQQTQGTQHMQRMQNVQVMTQAQNVNAPTAQQQLFPVNEPSLTQYLEETWDMNLEHRAQYLRNAVIRRSAQTDMPSISTAGNESNASAVVQHQAHRPTVIAENLAIYSHEDPPSRETDLPGRASSPPRVSNTLRPQNASNPHINATSARGGITTSSCGSASPNSTGRFNNATRISKSGVYRGRRRGAN